MPVLQDWIHKFEQGAGARYLKIAAFGIAVLFLVVIYNLYGYRNFATQEAMDSAQLAHNIAEGNGYTTLFIRPFSLYLVQSHSQAKTADALASCRRGLRANQDRPSGSGQSAGISLRAGGLDESAPIPVSPEP